MIFIGIGSNLPSSFGNKFKNIDLAISFLQEKGVKLLKKSSFYETFSQPNKNNPKFLNVVILVETNLSPVDLMLFLISIEKKLGRKRGRNFVLHPLKEISSDSNHPKTKKNINDLIDNLKTSNNEITKLSENDIKVYVK